MLQRTTPVFFAAISMGVPSLSVLSHSGDQTSLRRTTDSVTPSRRDPSRPHP